MKGKKKEKIIYYDDGSTVSDMSGVKNGLFPKEKPNKKRVSDSSFADKMKTYFGAVKMTIVPMFIVLLVLAALFIVMILIGKFI